MFQSFTSTTMCQSRSQDDGSMMIVSIEANGVSDAMLSGRASRVEGACVSTNFMLPKRRFWKAGPTFPNGFSKHFSTIRSPNRVLKPLKKVIRRRIRKSWFDVPSFGRGKLSRHLDDVLTVIA